MTNDIAALAEPAIRLGFAASLGFLVGLERELAGQAAGERTHAMVALGAASFTYLGLAVFEAEAARIAAGVVTGLGFLGAGMIFRDRENMVRGLTTAAGIRVTGAVGVANATGRYGVAAITAGFAVLLLLSERWWKRLGRHSSSGID